MRPGNVADQASEKGPRGVPAARMHPHITAHNADYVGQHWPVRVRPVHRDCFTKQSSCAWWPRCSWHPPRPDRCAVDGGGTSIPVGGFPVRSPAGVRLAHRQISHLFQHVDPSPPPGLGASGDVIGGPVPVFCRRIPGVAVARQRPPWAGWTVWRFGGGGRLVLSRRNAGGRARSAPQRCA